MCLPAAAAAPLAIASTVISTTGTMLSAVGQSQQYRYQASVEQQNAKIANGQALDSIQNANLEARQLARKHAELSGQQVAAMAANGVDLSFGSAADVQRDTDMLYDEDRVQLYKDAASRTRNFEVEAFNYKSRAASDRAKAKGAITAGILSSLGTALGGASQIAGMKGGAAPKASSNSNAWGISGSDGIW